ncbi:MAG: thioredoxin-like domain-containing protein [Bacteroidales bacterium]|nr:thioredoxin-like domain-containing protein [Bacteroidales bacterium]
MKNYSSVFIVISLLFLSLTSKAQYAINVEIESNKDSIMYLGYYYLKNTFALDSAYNKKGKFVFEDKTKTLEPGIYFFSNANGKYCEFIVDKEKNFSLITKENDWVKNMKVKKSKDNELYFEYLRGTSYFGDQANKVAKLKGEIGHEQYNIRVEEIRKSNDSIKENFIKIYPNHLLTKVLNATKSITIPEPETIYNKDNSVDSAAMQNERFNYYVHHYFDNMDFKCDGLLRTPEAVFHKSYNYYWDELMKYQTKDSIFNLAVHWIEKSRGTKNLFKFLVHDITERYLKSPYMGHDEIYIKMINKYYASGDATWMPPSAIDKEVARAKKWENAMFMKQVPDLACPDTNDVLHSLYEIDAKYKILIFWSYDCGHCSTEIPKIYNFYKKNKDVYDVEVMAVNSGTDLKQWKEKIKILKLDWLNVNGLVANYDWHEYFDIESTPVVLILDKDNRIIGKKIPADNIENYIKLYNEGKIKI